MPKIPVPQSVWAIDGSEAQLNPDTLNVTYDPTNSLSANFGQNLINTVDQTYWVYTGTQWLQLESGGGGGDFANLTVNPGPLQLISNIDAPQRFLVSLNGGITETAEIIVAQGTGNESILLSSAEGGIAINAGLGNVNAVTIDASDVAGGMTLTAGTAGIFNTINNGPFSVTTGTGAINIGADAAAHTITLGNAIGATSVVLNAGTGAVNIGTNAIAHTTTVGSVTGNASTVIQGGTTGLNLVTTATGTITIGNNAVANTIAIGTGADAKIISLGSSTAGSTLQFNSPAIAGIKNSNGTQVAGWYVGTGAPTVGPLIAPQGSMYTNIAGNSTSTRLYVASDSVGGWTNVTTAA